MKYSSRKNPAQKYIGTTIPKEIKQITDDFEIESFRKDKEPLLNKIKQNYSNHIKSSDKKIVQNEFHGFKISHTYSTQKIEGSTMTLGQTHHV